MKGSLIVGTMAAVGVAGVLLNRKSHEENHRSGNWSGHLSEAIVERDGKHYEVWGLICPDCGYVNVDGFAGVKTSIGPVTAWTDQVFEEEWFRSWDQSEKRSFVIDFRSDDAKLAMDKQ